MRSGQPSHLFSPMVSRVQIMIRVLVVDDHPLVRQGIAAVLARSFPGACIAEASDGAEALRALCNGAWDLVLLDLSLPGRPGLDILKEIRGICPRLPVLVLSMHPEHEFATRVLRAGASGYLTKGSPSEVLVSAVHKVLAGGKFISERMGEVLAADLDRDFSRPAHESLSDREYDVMLRLASGDTVGEIAAEVHLSVKTISTYRARVLAKMGMRNNAALTQYGLRQKLIA